jgi:hypothetical protein
LGSLSSKFNFILFGLGVVSMDSNFTFVLPMLYLRTLRMCVKFVLILALGFLHRN